jgi:CDGSH-type Zn-finger protein
MSDVQITATPDGPLKVQGPIDLFDTDGASVSVPEAKAIFLCRCGASSNKPFCDGTHSKIGFAAARQAVPESNEES